MIDTSQQIITPETVTTIPIITITAERSMMETVTIVVNMDTKILIVGIRRGLKTTEIRITTTTMIPTVTTTTTMAAMKKVLKLY